MRPKSILIERSVARAIGRKKIAHLAALGSLALLAAPGMAGQADDSDVLEEVIVTAQFREQNLQETPLSITAISGEQLEDQGLTNVSDLGLVIPNANIRQQGNIFGPNPQIGMRGVNTNEFIYTAEPGVAVYVDDVYHGTLTGSAMDLLDLERVEVLRGPQGTLFGKNALGGAIRLISKTPKGDDTGYAEVTVGSSNRLDFKAGMDFKLAEDLFLRLSGVSKRIDGYQDRLDFACQMAANGTPSLSGTLPPTQPSNAQFAGDCKIGENGGAKSDAVRAMLRWVASDDLEMNLSADYTTTDAQPGADSVISPRQANVVGSSDWVYNNNVIQPQFNMRFDDGRWVTGNPYKTYADFNDPVSGRRWPAEQETDTWSVTGKVDYDFTDNLHLMVVGAYRTYDSNWASDGDFTAFDLNTTLNLQSHEQTSFEARLTGGLFDDSVQWTVGAFYYDSSSVLGGYVTFGALDYFYYNPTPGQFGIPNFTQNDHFTTESMSAFAHAVWQVTDRLALTGGVRQTSEDKTFAFDHTNYLTVPVPLEYGSSHFDWKLAVDYKLGDATMIYGMASTGFRSEGAQPRPFIPDQLLPVPGEEILAYEIGMKSDFFDRRLRTNVALFLNDYDPRVTTRFGVQCNFPGGPPGDFYPFGLCPAGTPLAGNFGIPWINYFSAPGQATGAELEVTAQPIPNLMLNGTMGYYKYESDASQGEQGYIDPSVREQPQLSYSLGAQYSWNFASGGSLIPRLDLFYQGYRTNGTVDFPQLKPENVVPSNTLVNLRVTYAAADGKWNTSLAVENLFDDFYWITLGPEYNNTPGNAYVYNRNGVPSRGREVALTFRRTFD